MRLLYHAFLLALTTSLFAAGEFDFLPETVATVDEVAITRDSVVKRLRQNGNYSDKNSRAQLTVAAKNAAETEIYFYLLRQLLNSENITPSQAAATQKLAEMTKLMPHGLAKIRQETLKNLAESENFRWNVALQQYLTKVAPEVIEVDSAEIEQLYRLNQEYFRLPEQYQFGVIRVLKQRKDAKEMIETAYDRLRQGENFDRVASEIAPDGEPTPDAELLEILKQGDPTLQVNSISRVLENSDAYFLIKVKSKTAGKFIPLSEVAP
ncbi:MAG: peptidyl-prolyl cis-trans isomerase, partial [Victivallales bacterium]|nr:peptidyl-prolyl cis-trans isomerase [Victivallales bacterium]